MRFRFIGLYKSTRKSKKYMVKFQLDDGRVKTIHFGQAGMSDYTQHHDPDRKARYLARHERRENWDDPTTPGALSRWILWNLPDLQLSLIDFKKRFMLADALH
jgi:hypothetical protein